MMKQKSLTLWITQVALLTTLCVVGRIFFAFIPNVQPVTAIIAIVTILLGFKDGVIISSLTMLVSNLILGMGPWVILQIISYLIVVIFVYFSNRFLEKMVKSDYILFGSRALVTGIAGILYGFSISWLWTFLIQVENFWVYYLNGLPFDFAHSAGNVVFFILLFPLLNKLFQRYAVNYQGSKAN
ncbi:ECF transporter S component [Globicatella sanguinis]